MAVRAPRPCKTPGCAHLSRDGSGWCSDHKTEQKWESGWNRTTKGSAHSRGYGAAWRKLRDRVLRRDNYLCQPCKAKGLLTPANEVDHIIPKSEGGTDNPENCQSICKLCHRAKSTAEGLRGRGDTKSGERR